LFIALFAPGLAGAPAPAAFPTRRSSDLRAALAALRSGRSISAVSRATGVSRAALRSWRDGTRGARTSGCPRCASVPGPPEPQAAYAYLLGQYLGDGTLSRGRGNVWSLRIACADSYPLIMAECAGAVDRKSTRLNSSHVKISYAV